MHYYVYNDTRIQGWNTYYYTLLYHKSTHSYHRKSHYILMFDLALAKSGWGIANLTFSYRVILSARGCFWCRR